MTNPGIEIRWGAKDYPDEGNYRIQNAEQRQRIRPKIASAAQIAIEAVAGYGIGLTSQKYAYLYAASPRSKDFMAAITTKTMTICLSPGASWGRIDEGFYAAKIGHELAHQERAVLIPEETVGETAATEGVAYHLDYLIRTDGRIRTWKYPQTPVVEQIAAGGLKLQRELDRLYTALESDFDKSIHDPAMEHWHRRYRVLGIRAIDLVGIAAVGGQLRAGYDIAELWNTPAIGALGYEPAEAAA